MNALDLKEATVEAQGMAMGVFEDIKKEIQEGYIMKLAMEKWAKATPEEKELFKKQQPLLYAQFMEALNE